MRDSPLPSRGSRVGNFLVGSTIWEGLLFVGPFIITGIGALTIPGSDVPAFYVYCGLVLLFAMSATGMLRISEWWYRISPRNKLAYSNGRIAVAVDGAGDPQALTLGFIVRNLAEFPLTFVVEEIDCRVGTTVSKHPHTPVPITMSPKGDGWYEGGSIEVPGLSLGQAAEGHLRAIVRYGRTRSPRHTLVLNKRVHLAISTDGTRVHSEWFDC